MALSLIRRGVPGLLGGGDFTILMRDYFNTDRAAGSVNGTAAEPGVDTRTVKDTANHLSISGAELVTDGNGSAWGDPNLVYSGQTRVAGKAFLFDLNGASNNFNSWVGWNRTATPGTPPGADGGSLGWGTGALPVFGHGTGVGGNGGTSELLPLLARGRCALVLYSTGAAMWLNNSGTWEHQFYLTTAVTTPLYPAFSHSHVGGVRTLDNVVLAQMIPAEWLTLYGFATVNATASLTSIYTGTADAVNNFDYTLPVAPNPGDEVGFKYRRQNATNYWHANVTRNGGDTDWDARLDSVAAGVATNRVVVLSVGDTNAVRVQCDDTKHALFTTNTSDRWFRRGADVDVSHMDTETAITAEYAAGTTASRLVSIPRTDSRYNILGSIN